MAEKRMIGRAVSQSRKVNSLSLKAALLWTWCIPWFDVSGFLEVEPDFLKSNIVLRRKDILEDEIPFLVSEIIEDGLWEEFISSDGKRVVREIKFFDFQNIRESHEAKSKFLGAVSKISRKRKRKIIPYEIREAVFQRDKYICRYCGVKCQMGFWGASYDDDFDNSKCITLDHKVPISKGGEDSIENLVTACFHCNASKCNKNLPNYRPITDQLQTKDEPTPAQDKIDEVKIREVNKDSKDEKLPSLLPTPDQKKQLATICAQLIKKYNDKFNPFQWIQKNITLLPKTHIQVLTQINNGEINNPWAYANKISLIIEQNLNEEDFQKQADQIKSEFSITAKNFFNGDLP